MLEETTGRLSWRKSGFHKAIHNISCHLLLPSAVTFSERKPKGDGPRWEEATTIIYKGTEELENSSSWLCLNLKLLLLH